MLIGTLSMIEGPHGQPSNAINATYITSSLRNTINHLRTHVGNWFYLRGFALVLIHDIARDTILPALLPINDNSPLQRDIRSLVSAAVLATLQVLWVHIVITRPSPKSLYQRLPSLNCSLRVIPIALLECILCKLAVPITLLVELHLIEVVGKVNIDQNLDNSQAAAHVYALAAVAPTLMKFWLALPARVVLVRIAASTVPDDDELIVPLDPRLKGGGAPLGIFDAWRKDSWARACKIQTKGFIAGVAIFLLGQLVLPDFRSYVPFLPMWFNS
ncbi:hypothetical protein ANOM_009252 [Aspergillus nomiae NRRL 13137]|uniref:Uncharacterized protein n=1 Tax=Aspergillus nomiae NRRL (strain ATCC 15546 / NRRL 13137 / CBS 260.88 / M93) TaxID=1509407 RepID=A0A0L1ITH4_ASPN3|nr:uncharacterized protein ANOM_009252 [Aspergillus nomiae NRRL 13137]KNG82802.1 hypothetical protein ANOM_009252 [Aspergillus nomiae NRRL 13137]